MGGRAPYRFRTEPIIIDGIHTKKLVIEPTEAAFVRKMYDMYIDPRISLHDIATQLTAQGVRSFFGKPFSRSTISLILRNPIYAMADLDIYEFFKSQGTEIYNDAADFVGTNGCYYYRSKGSTILPNRGAGQHHSQGRIYFLRASSSENRDAEIYNDAADFVGTNGCYYYRSKGSTDNKHKYLQGQMLVLAPSEGFIPSELWLRVRKKIMASQSYQPARKARHSWMAGKIKCGNCGYALMAAHSCGHLYFRCSKHAENKSCPGCGAVRLHDLEEVVYQQMVKKLEDYRRHRCKSLSLDF